MTSRPCERPLLRCHVPTTRVEVLNDESVRRGSLRKLHLGATPVDDAVVAGLRAGVAQGRGLPCRDEDDGPEGDAGNGGDGMDR